MASCTEEIATDRIWVPQDFRTPHDCLKAAEEYLAGAANLIGPGYRPRFICKHRRIAHG